MAWHVRWETFFSFYLPGWWWWGSSAETVPHYDPETPCVERRTTKKRCFWRRVVTWSVFVLAFPRSGRLPCHAPRRPRQVLADLGQILLGLS